MQKTKPNTQILNSNRIQLEFASNINIYALLRNTKSVYPDAHYVPPLTLPNPRKIAFQILKKNLENVDVDYANFKDSQDEEEDIKFLLKVLADTKVKSITLSHAQEDVQAYHAFVNAYRKVSQSFSQQVEATAHNNFAKSDGKDSQSLYSPKQNNGAEFQQPEILNYDQPQKDLKHQNISNGDYEEVKPEKAKIHVDYIKGDLTSQKADAILFTYSNQKVPKNQQSPLLNVIVNKGGNKVFEAFQQSKNPVDAIYNDRLKMHVMHASLDIYSHYYSKNKLEDTLIEIFKCAEKKKLKHIFMPVIGAGYLQFPPSVFPSALKEAISQYQRYERQHFHQLTICDNNLDAVYKFEAEWKKVNALIGNVQNQGEFIQKKNQAEVNQKQVYNSDIVQASQMYNQYQKKIEVDFKIGEIIYHQADAILINYPHKAKHESAYLDYPVLQQILTMGGKSLLEKLYYSKNKVDAFYSPELKKHVLFIPLPPYKDQWSNESFQKTLIEALSLIQKSYKVTHITMPTLGGHWELNYPEAVFPNALLQAIRVAESMPNNSISKITICDQISKTEYLQSFFMKWGQMLQRHDQQQVSKSYDMQNYARTGVKSADTFQFQNDGLTIKVLQEDILVQKVEIITNAANSRLNHAGGIAFAISQAAGWELQAFCDERIEERGQVRTGSYIMSPSFNLKQFKKIAHLVGPIYDPTKHQQNIEELYNGVFSLLLYCEANSFKSIALPGISAGIYGFPKQLCAQTILRAIYDFQKRQYQVRTDQVKQSLKLIHLVNIDPDTHNIFSHQIKVFSVWMKENQTNMVIENQQMDHQNNAVNSQRQVQGDLDEPETQDELQNEQITRDPQDNYQKPIDSNTKIQIVDEWKIPKNHVNEPDHVSLSQVHQPHLLSLIQVNQSVHLSKSQVIEQDLLKNQVHEQNLLSKSQVNEPNLLSNSQYYQQVHQSEQIDQNQNEEMKEDLVQKDEVSWASGDHPSQNQDVIMNQQVGNSQIPEDLENVQSSTDALEIDKDNNKCSEPQKPHSQTSNLNETD